METNKDLKKSLSREAERMHAKEPAHRRAALFQFFYTIIFAFFLAIILHTFVFQVTMVKGSSMSPTFVERERVFVEKISYKFVSPKRKQVVIARYKPDGDQVIKRIIGLPGDYVEVHDGVLLVNGHPIEESYWDGDIVVGNNFGVSLVPEGHVFLVGDNRNNSDDSRNYLVNTIPQEQIVGHVTGIIWPFNRIGGYPQ